MRDKNYLHTSQCGITGVTRLTAGNLERSTSSNGEYAGVELHTHFLCTEMNRLVSIISAFSIGTERRFRLYVFRRDF